ncbi:methyl-accepting chemotaxis protein [Thalassotalea euphylliae]|uniref:methyl-accepting chemotaxis protein n=1 Tax=Thalassotalea euphylliae TaxID=1655234 RepID=UPI0036279291
MNLKVAQKIMLGFAIILLLLIVTSVSSIGILADIENATEQVDNLALPIQKQSSNIQISLLKQAKQASQIESVKSLEQLQQLKETFAQEGQQLGSVQKALSSLPLTTSMKKRLSAFEKDYQGFTSLVEQTFSHRERVIIERGRLLEFEEQLNLHLDEAGALLVDLTYLDDPDEQATIDRIAGSAGQIEGYLINVTDASKGIIALGDIQEVIDNRTAIEQSVRTIEQLTDYLKVLGESYDTDGLIDMFVEEFDKSKVLLIGENSLFDVKVNQLEHAAKVAELTEQSEVQINVALDGIDGLLSEVDKNLTSLQTAVFDNVNNGQTLTSVILVVMIAVSIGIAFLTIRAMMTPLTRINQALSYIAKGDLSKQLTIDSQDEYGELAANVNSVVSHLKSLIDEISQNSHALNHAATRSEEELQMVSDALNTQQSTVAEMAQITGILNQNADDVLAKSTDAEKQMTQALAHSNDLKARANSTAGKINELSTMLDDTAGLISVLNQEATNISSILETIQSIADQTNLLALNAAIEAARAGEAGRGFSVVADEVRMLASRTQESTAEINAMIESLQRQTTQVVSEIEQGKNGAKHCQEDTSLLLETLVTINTAIEQMHDMSEEISTSATEQNRLSTDINSGIAQVSEISRDSSEKSSGTLTYSQEVAALSKQLEKAVDAFKVS